MLARANTSNKLKPLNFQRNQLTNNTLKRFTFIKCIYTVHIPLNGVKRIWLCAYHMLCKVNCMMAIGTWSKWMVDCMRFCCTWNSHILFYCSKQIQCNMKQNKTPTLKSLLQRKETNKMNSTTYNYLRMNGAIFAIIRFEAG